MSDQQQAESVHLGERLRETRESRGLSYRQAADQIGVPVATVHKIEHGGDPRWSSVVRVLAWIGEADSADQIGDLQVQLDAAKSANTAVWVAAERASRKGYDLDPDEVLDMLKEGSNV